MHVSRRTFVVGGAAALVAGLLPRPSRAAATASTAFGYGPLVPDPAGILDLPAGFRYRILERRGDPMDDGYLVPGRADGMACFPGPDGTLVLMRNHENSPGDLANGPYRPGQSPPAETFQPNGMGGVTRLVVDARTLERVSSNLVLVGTARNCAGGPSPWGWISCEEYIDGGHGWAFLCSTEAATVQPPQPLVGYGRFHHEAVAIDPLTHAAYLTEDRTDSCLYRFLPADPALPFVGKLQALRVVGRPRFDTGTGLQVGDGLPIEWVDVVDAQPVGDTLRSEAASNGAALIRRGEGIWWKDGRCYVVSSTGGPVSGGQVFELDPAAATLRLVVQSNDTNVLHMPDNITVAPWHELFLAEDGAAGNYLRVADTDGNVADFAYNDLSGSEFCGVCFSPDGRALFVNLQLDGLTIVVTGPFPTTSHEPAVDPIEPAPADPFGAVDSAGGGGGCDVDAGAGNHDARATAVVVGAALLGAGLVRRDES